MGKGMGLTSMSHVQTKEEEESRGKAGRKRKETPVRATRNTRAKGGPSDPPPLSGEDNTDEVHGAGLTFAVSHVFLCLLCRPRKKGM